TGIGLNGSLSCPSTLDLVTVEIQRLTTGGLPDGTTIATGAAYSSSSGFSAIAVSPAIDVPIDARFAFILSAPVVCTLSSTSTSDTYQAGDAYTTTGGSWATLLSVDGRYDVPAFRTLVQPAIDVAYQTSSRGFHRAALLTNNALADYGKVLLTGNGQT